MKDFSYVVNDPMGIHARPAGLLVKAAAKFESSVKLSANGKEVDAKRIMAVMGLGVKAGQSVKVIADGKDEAQAIEEMQKFFKENL